MWKKRPIGSSFQGSWETSVLKGTRSSSLSPLSNLLTSETWLPKAIGFYESWRDGSVLKSSCCSCTGPRFNSQHPRVAHNSLIIQEVWCLLPTSMGTRHARDAHTHTTHTHQTEKNTHTHQIIFQRKSSCLAFILFLLPSFLSFAFFCISFKETQLPPRKLSQVAKAVICGKTRESQKPARVKHKLGGFLLFKSVLEMTLSPGETFVTEIW